MSQNPDANAGLTNRQKWSLEGKARQAWKCYFISQDRMLQLLHWRQTNRTAVEQVRQNNVDYEHLKQLFLDLYEKVGEMTDCPICLEPMTKDKTHLPLCGHLICKDCKTRIDTCPICRKKY